MKSISRRTVLKAAGAVVVYSALPAGVAAFTRMRSARYSDPTTIVPNLYEWWTANDTSTMFQNVAGSVAVTGDNQPVRHWVGKVNGTVLTNSGDTDPADPYRTNRIGSMPAVAFSSAQSGLKANPSHTCADGATLIVIGKLTGTQIWRGIMALNTDTSNDPGNSTYGVALGTRENGDKIGMVRNNILVSTDVSLNTPLVLVATVNQTVPSPSEAGWAGSTLSGYRSLSVNGGFPADYAVADEQNMVDSTYVSVGCGTNTRYSPKFDVCDALLVDGPCTPETLQALYDEYIYPTYGNYFTMEPYPSKKGLCNPFSGPGLNCSFHAPPLQDLVAMGITWVRIDVVSTTSSAGLEDMLTAYHSAGIDICWLLADVWDSSSDPEDFRSPSPEAQTICDLYDQYGLGTPFFELGNEIFNFYLSHFSSNETACADAYLDMMANFRTEMTGYDYYLCGGNDTNVLTRVMYERAVERGIMPDLWGLHYYNIEATDAYGTSNIYKEICQSSIVCTESNTPDTVSVANARDWFCDMVAEMGTEPWIYYCSATTTYNTTNNAYAWYSSNGAWDGHGILRFPPTGRSATIEDTATALTIELPTYVDANSISTLLGTSSSGSASSIALPDDYYYQVSAVSSSGHSVTETEIQFTVPSSVTSVAFNCGVRATIADLRAYIYVWDWNGSTWEALGDFDVDTAGKAEKIYSVPDGLLGSSHTMKVKIHVTDKATGVYPSFNSKLDLAQLVVGFT